MTNAARRVDCMSKKFDIPEDRNQSLLFQRKDGLYNMQFEVNVDIYSKCMAAF